MVSIVLDRAEPRTRSFAAGKATFVVECPSVHVRDAVEALFTDLPGGEERPIDRVITISEGDEGTLCVESGDEFHGPEQRPNNALATLTTAVTRLSLDCEPEWLHLHCAGLELDGRGVLISASSGTGKTTLTAALVARGWTYISDESVAIESDASCASGFAKPLMIKTGARELLPQLAAHRVSLKPDDELYWHVPASAIPATITERLEPALVVILQRSADGLTDIPAAPALMERADTVVALMGETMDAVRFGPDAVLVLARLVARCTCVSLSVGPLDSSAKALVDLIATPPEPKEVVALDDLSGSTHHGWTVPESVRSVMIDNRVVAHDTSGGSIIALDEVGSGVWAALLGEPPGWWRPQVLETPSTGSFLRQLASHGLLIPPEAPTEEVTACSP